MARKFTLFALAGLIALAAQPAYAAGDPVVPDMVEQYAQVLDNLYKAESLSGLPDPIDTPQHEPVDGGDDGADAGAEPDDSGADDSGDEGRDWENTHPDGPF